jgi:hypothetical protein
MIGVLLVENMWKKFHVDKIKTLKKNLNNSLSKGLSLLRLLIIYSIDWSLAHHFGNNHLFLLPNQVIQKHK